MFAFGNALHPNSYTTIHDMLRPRQAAHALCHLIIMAYCHEQQQSAWAAWQLELAWQTVQWVLAQYAAAASHALQEKEYACPS